MGNYSRLTEKDLEQVWLGVNKFGDKSNIIQVLAKADIELPQDATLDHVSRACLALYWERRSDEFSMKLCNSESARYDQERYTQHLFAENERLSSALKLCLGGPIGGTIEPEPAQDA